MVKHIAIWKSIDMSGKPEESGTIGVIGFKVLREESTNIRFENTSTMPNGISGTYL